MTHKVIEYAAKVWFIIFICKHQVIILDLIHQRRNKRFWVMFLATEFYRLWFDMTIWIYFQDAFNRWNIVPAFFCFQTLSGTGCTNGHWYSDEELSPTRAVFRCKWASLLQIFTCFCVFIFLVLTVRLHWLMQKSSDRYYLPVIMMLPKL